MGDASDGGNSSRLALAACDVPAVVRPSRSATHVMLTVTLVGAVSFARELSLGGSLVTRPTRGGAGRQDSRAEPTRCTAGEEQWEAGGGARSPGPGTATLWVGVSDEGNQ